LNAAPGIRRLHSLTDAQVEELARVLIDCVEGGASVGFLLPLTPQRALEFWQRVARAVADGRRAIFIAEEQGRILGTVQLVLDMAENQPHRGEISKMLVRTEARRRGVGEALLRAAEAAARAAGRTLLVLDTATPDAARLYERLGWERSGDIPDYALYPDGSPCTTTFYYRRLAGAS